MPFLIDFKDGGKMWDDLCITQRRGGGEVKKLVIFGGDNRGVANCLGR